MSRSTALAFIHTRTLSHLLPHSHPLSLPHPHPLSQLTREIRLRDVVLESFVPLSALQLIEERAQWDAMNDAWHIPGIEYAGNQVWKGGLTRGMRALEICTTHTQMRLSLSICTMLSFHVLIRLFHFCLQR